MAWMKVDDSLAFHAKTVAAGNPAMGLWVRAGAWSSALGTDGLVPSHMVATLGTKTQATALVKAGLWLEDPQGYRFHDWLDYQPTAREVTADRAAKSESKREAGRLGGIASGVARRSNSGSKREANGEAKGKQNEAPSRPVPTRTTSTTVASLPSDLSNPSGLRLVEGEVDVTRARESGWDDDVSWADA